MAFKAVIINNEFHSFVEAENLIETLIGLVQNNIYKPWKDNIQIVNEADIPELKDSKRTKPFR